MHVHNNGTLGTLLLTLGWDRRSNIWDGAALFLIACVRFFSGCSRLYDMHDAILYRV